MTPDQTARLSAQHGATTRPPQPTDHQWEPYPGSGVPSDAAGHVPCPDCPAMVLVTAGRYIDHTRETNQ